MKQKYFFFILVFFFLFKNSSGQTTYSWRNDQASAASGQWNDSNNWWNGSGPELPGGGEILFLDGTEGTAMTNDLPSINRYRIEFYDATSSRTINGTTENTFFDFGGNKPKIENQSSVNHTIGFPIKLGYNPLEINPVNGDLTITNNIDTNGNFIDVFGDNSKFLNVSGLISGSGGVVLKQNSTIVYSSDNTYSGITRLESGTLRLQANLVNSDITVQNGGNLEIDGDDVTIKSLTVDAGGTVTINPGKGLTITGALNNSGTITLGSLSNSYSSLIPTSYTGSGTFQYNRYTAQVGPTGTNDLVSSPVTSQLFGAFATANSDLATSGTTAAYGPFDNSANPGEYVNYNTSSDAGVTLVAGKGYRAGTDSGSTLLYSGSPNSGTVNIAITAETGNFGIWNLIGNPYPSYLHLNDFLTLEGIVNNDEFDSSFAGVYGYDGNVDDGWAIWNLAYSIDNPNALIAPGQGFFVPSKAGGGSVDFTNDMRRTGSSQDFIPTRSSSPLNIALAKLNLNSDTNVFSTDIYFIDNVTRGLDSGYDTGAFGGSAKGIYTNLVENHNGVEYAIQSLPYEDLNDVVVPLGIKADQGVQIALGLDPNSNMPENINIYLEDSVENTWTLLNTSDYVLTPTVNLNDTGRFFVHFTTSTLAVDENTLNGLQIYVAKDTKTIFVKGQLINDSTVVIYDIQGRKVLENQLNSSHTTNEIEANNLSAGLYIIKLQQGELNRTQKVIIN